MDKTFEEIHSILQKPGLLTTFGRSDYNYLT